MAEQTYVVRLTAMAFVEQEVTVRASSQEEAERLAKGQAGDGVWSYQGVDDTTVEADARPE
jgi:hypothetical protein